MKFRFCGDNDCPDWILAEIYTLSKLSSVKLKLLGNAVAQGIVNPPFDYENAAKLFADSRLDADVDLKACVACITYILTSATRFNCDSNALQTELQQLGLPREHSTSIKRTLDDQFNNLTEKLASLMIRVNPLDSVTAKIDPDTKFVLLDLVIEGQHKNVTLTPSTLKILIDNLKYVRSHMVQVNEQ